MSNTFVSVDFKESFIDNTKQFIDKNTPQMLEEISKGLQDSLRDNAPVLTGALRDSITMGDIKNKGFEFYAIYYAAYVIGNTEPNDFVSMAIREYSASEMASRVVEFI